MNQPNRETEPIIPELLLTLLSARGYKSESEMGEFLHPMYPDHLHDPFLLTDMGKAVDRIESAVKSGQKIVIYGDYDIDGITASTVMLETIENLGGRATSYIPDRFEEGYGINLTALKQLKAAGTDLVISVDCGVTSVLEIDWANSNGLDVVITDHHAVPEIIPNAIAVINPKRPGDKYPFKELAGVGVAFKLAQALQQRTGRPRVGQEKWLLDMVALGTVCDVVPLVGENRVLVTYGLKVLRQTKRIGLQRLAEVAGVSYTELSAYHLGFVLGPRLNAAGRLEHASRSLELLRLDDGEMADVIAGELNELNQKRQADQAKILKAANLQAENYLDDPVLVLANEEWSHGVVGIVASKLVEKWRKPTLIGQIMGDKTKGSARSTGQFDLVAGLRSVGHHFDRFGGHYFAAGFTLNTSALAALRSDINKYYRSLKLSPDKSSLKQPDLELDGFALLDEPLYMQLQRLEPFGQGNPKPLFKTKAVIKAADGVGSDGSHLKIEVQDDGGVCMKGIGFGLAAADQPVHKIGDKVIVVFQLNLNEYRGKSNLELLVVQITNE